MSHVTRKSPGRPAESEGVQRGELLDGALQLFAQQGIGGTSLSAIARQAGVTPALLHYYFGNKEALVDTVWRERILPALQPVAGFPAQQGAELTGRELVLAFAQTIIRVVASIDWLPSLWIREVLSPDGQLRPRLTSTVLPQVIGVLTEHIRQGQAAGEINAELDPRLVPVSIIGLTVFALAARPIWGRLPGNEDIDADGLARHVTHLLDHGTSPAHAR